MPTPPRTTGIKIILAWKCAKAPLMFALALWLTFAPQGAYRLAESLSVELSGGSATAMRIGAWIHDHVTQRVVTGAAVLAWLDGLATVAEVVLLWIGKPWGEWIVTIGLATLVPVELVSLEQRPGVGKLLVLAANAAVVVYLFRRRMLERSERARRAAADTMARASIRAERPR
jgi:uncharacterized membrane protein (DUF2068 family)